MPIPDRRELGLSPEMMRAIAAVITSALRDNDPALDAEPDAATLLRVARTLGPAGALSKLPMVPDGDDVVELIAIL